jgi:DNA-binding response OmpR family regulator
MIDVMISKIRKKLSSGPYPAPKIMTINGLGYRFAAAHA